MASAGTWEDAREAVERAIGARLRRKASGEAVEGEEFVEEDEEVAEDRCAGSEARRLRRRLKSEGV